MTTTHVAFTDFVNLASERVGARVLEASDEFFAPKENLVLESTPIFIPDRYTDVGKWMDGWESRRKRVPGHDWCVIQLGLPGEIRGVDVDTSHFLGNYPEYVSIEAAAGKPGEWKEILPKSPLRGGTSNLFPVTDTGRWTHLRLNIHPDGGVARLRVYGLVRPQPTGGVLDLAALENGGRVVVCSDRFFSHPENLIMPGRARHMGEGWETRRRRGPGHDWVILKLGTPGRIRKVELDTHHYKGNFPESASLDVANLGDLQACDFRDRTDIAWESLLPRTPLKADHRHTFEGELKGKERIVSHVRLNIYPDGGVSRLRIHGEPA